MEILTPLEKQKSRKTVPSSSASIQALSMGGDQVAAHPLIFKESFVPSPQKTVRKILQKLGMRVSIINQYARITGNSIPGVTKNSEGTKEVVV